jgi:Flp pilus assembly protein TadB
MRAMRRGHHGIQAAATMSRWQFRCRPLTGVLFVLVLIVLVFIVLVLFVLVLFVLAGSRWYLGSRRYLLRPRDLFPKGLSINKVVNFDSAFGGSR